MNSNLETRKILGYDDVLAYEQGSDSEQLVDIRQYDSTVQTEYIKKDMLSYTGEVIYVRDTLAKKVANISCKLNKLGFLLKIEYGYRHPDIQRAYFETRRNILKIQNPKLSEDDLDRLTHAFVAVPGVAGHPAGAAIDLTYTTMDGQDVDMGTAIADYTDSKKIITFAEGLTEAQVKNRMLLHDLMLEENFAPFYGEWWHFSYGDREWAAFYNKKALYGAIDFKSSGN